MVWNYWAVYFKLITVYCSNCNQRLHHSMLDNALPTVRIELLSTTYKFHAVNPIDGPWSFERNIPTWTTDKRQIWDKLKGSWVWEQRRVRPTFQAKFLTNQNKWTQKTLWTFGHDLKSNFEGLRELIGRTVQTTDGPTDRRMDGRTKWHEDFLSTQSKIVAKALNGQRYPLPGG